METLLVEDDEFKAADLMRSLEKARPGLPIHRAASVTSAMRAVTASEFSLVVLDMSLPTFDLSGPGGGGSPQSQGGLEVLRLARRKNHSCPFIIVTQYPDIEIDGFDVPLAKAAAILSKKFGANVLACVAYEFDRANWRDGFQAAVMLALSESF